MVGMDVEHATPVATHHLTSARGSLIGIEPEKGHRPSPRIREGSQLGRSRSRQVGDEGRPDRSPPARGSGEYRPDGASSLETEALEGVDSAEHLSDIGALGIELEGDVVPVADHDVSATREAVAIHLIAVPKAGLGHPVTVFHLRDETTDVEEIIAVESAGVLGDHGAKQDASEPRCRIDWENQMTEGDPAGRLDGAGVEDLKLGQHHDQTVPVGDRPVAGSEECVASDPGSADVAQVLGR